jgi:hypothetical protein
MLLVRDLAVAAGQPAVMQALLGLHLRGFLASVRGRGPYRPSPAVHAAATALELPADALVYGETPFATARALFKACGVGAGDLVVDLGAGRGLVVLAAASLGANAVGVELDPARAALSAGSVHVGDARAAPLHNVACAVCTWTCWPDATRAELLETLAGLPQGARVWVTTWPIEDPRFEPMWSRQVPFSWGVATVLAYRRSAGPDGLEAPR